MHWRENHDIILCEYCGKKVKDHKYRLCYKCRSLPRATSLIKEDEEDTPSDISEVMDETIRLIDEMFK